MDKEIPVNHQIYAVTLMANRAYPHYTRSAVGTAFVIIPEIHQDDIHDECMEMCYKRFPTKDGYTGHTVGYCLIPRELTVIGAETGDKLKYRIHIVGVEEE